MPPFFVSVDARSFVSGRLLHRWLPMGDNDELEQLSEAVRERVKEIVDGTSYYLVEASVRGWRGTRSVEIFVDADEGMTLEATTELSREIRFVLDTDEVFADDYTLHVSSPGADRPLVHPRQFKKHVGRKLQVAFSEEDGKREMSGELVAATQDYIILIDPGTEEETKIPHEAVEEATVELPW